MSQALRGGELQVRGGALHLHDRRGAAGAVQVHLEARPESPRSEVQPEDSVRICQYQKQLELNIALVVNRNVFENAKSYEHN